MGLELVACHVKHDQFRIFLLDCKADGIGHMGFTKTGTAEDEQRVERSLARIARDVGTGGDCEFIAIPRYKIVEIIDRQEPGIDLDLLKAGIHEGARIAGRLITADADGLVDRRISRAFGQAHGVLVADGAD